MLENQPLNLFVIDDSSNDAETVSNMLRNAGHAVHTTRIEDDEDLRNGLSTQDCEMILAKPGLPYLNISQALEVIAQTGKGVPLLIIGDGVAEEKLTELLVAGARDLVFLSQPARLLHAVLRETGVARVQRRLNQCEAMLEETNHRAQNLVDSSRDAITYIHEGMYIYANESYLEMFGYTNLSELEGMPILNMVKRDDHARFKTFLRDYKAGKAKANSFNLTGLRADGSDFDITMEFSNAAFDGEPCTQIIIRAQVNNEELERRLKDMSKLDSLTGVYNRQYFLDELGQVIGKPGQEGAILYLEPDHFKTLRQELGLAPSDQVLAEMAGVLREAIGASGHFVARFEGEFFCALLKGVNQATAEAIADKLCKAIDAHSPNLNGKTVALTCSIGIALYNEGTADSQSLLQRAEKAMQEANETGGNRVKTYIPDPGEMAEHERLASIARLLREALRSNSLQLLYQPIVSIKGDSTQNYEVSVQVSDEDGQPVASNELLLAAEKNNLLPAMDRWVLAHAIRNVTEQRRQNKPVTLFVRITAASLRDPKLLPWLRDILKAAQAVPNTLVVEISEEVATTHLKPLQQFAKGLKQLGIRLALNEVGIGNNYATVLQHSQAEFLKPHPSFISELGSSPEAMEKLKEITELAASANQRVIANPVESPHTMALMFSTAVDYIQGSFLQEPGRQMDYDFSSMG